MNRALQEGMLDANSQLPLSFQVSPLINTNTTTTITAAGAGIFHGFLIISTSSTGAGAWNGILYDATPQGTLNSTTAIGVLASTTAAGATPFQWGGDVVYNNGLTLITSAGTAGAIKVIYL